MTDDCDISSISNIAFMGTLICSGQVTLDYLMNSGIHTYIHALILWFLGNATGIVISTALETEFGKTFKEMKVQIVANIHTFIHTFIHTYIHAYVHTYIHMIA